MTKNLFFSALTMMLCVCLSPLLAQTNENAVVKETRGVSAFSSIRLEGVGNIVFTQSSECRFQIEGVSSYIKQYNISVKGKELVITQVDNQSNKKKKQKVTFYVSAPDLSKVIIEGVGNFNAPNTLSVKNMVFKLEGVGNFMAKDLKCGILRLDLEGVGNLNLGVDCKKVEANLEGVGNITLSGSADIVRIAKEGTGKINIKKLTYRELSKKE